MYRQDKGSLYESVQADPLSSARLDRSSRKVTSLGVCLGASTVSMVAVEADMCVREHSEAAVPAAPRIVARLRYSHEGNPRQTLLAALDQAERYTADRIVATGRRFRHFVQMTSIPEPEAVEYAYRFVKPPDIFCPAVVSAGGETTMVYLLDRQGRISNVLTGNKCASGTGEFFLQQLRRMDVSLEAATQWAATEAPYQVSGRCSVFCKSDCTHATNKGIPKAKVTAGLCKMMAGKILELLKKVDRKNIMVTGGTAHNRMMIDYLRAEIPGLIVPDAAACFEALGAALWGLAHPTRPFPRREHLFVSRSASFDTLPPLADFEDRVIFKSLRVERVQSGDECILGLDVGSTTTKAILMRKADDAMLASIYLRTSGDPVEASRRCYRSIRNQIQAVVDPQSITISGLGVCGSGRQIAGLHALTDGIINEIIAHAAAAVYFDPEVDTLFEIGGQDAKYTYITNGVPSDYAMNEACSAGTGSFLEESALETLGIPMEDIAGIAVKGRRPPNFNDQCAAFIASDIKNAIHEGVRREDIVAGLVYSICMNYSNRVKGNRPVGGKVFMQGGVCYNRAVPLAMAALADRSIIVPPEPGLMGAFGVALEVKKRIDAGLLEEKAFDLETLADRTVAYKKSFTCRGGRERCDRRCEIAMIEIASKTYPFGGACNRYYNLRHDLQVDAVALDWVRTRQRLVFETPATHRRGGQKADPPARIGINRSFLTNTYFPFYETFFSELGLEVVLPDSPAQAGIDRRNAAFCYPGELAHGFFYRLIQMKTPPEFIFLPHIKAVPDQAGRSDSQVCPFAQGEPFYLQATFRQRLSELKAGGTRILTPLIDLSDGLWAAEKPMVETAVQAGFSRKAARLAFDAALIRQTACIAEMKACGRQVLDALAADPRQTAAVIFGRPYNGFVEEAHMGIPGKLASRGVPVLPLDFLPLENEPLKAHMYWGMGQTILKAAGFVAGHPQLFGVYITNFSCGPDSFLVGYFREIMGRKPSLTLELDSHTADAGLETRIEAFLDIVAAYRQLTAGRKIAPIQKTRHPCRTFLDRGIPQVVTSGGETLAMTDRRVTLLFPSMGKISTEAISAAFKGEGFNVVAHPPADEAVLKLGRANTSCKECLPLILTTGTLLNYVYHRKRKDEVLVYFMPTGSGPCRFGQYYIFMQDLIRRLDLDDVAIFSLTSENSYVGLGVDIQKRGWLAVIVSDVMEDIRTMILANAVDPAAALKLFDREWSLIRSVLEQGDVKQLEAQLARSSEVFSRIDIKQPSEKVPRILLTGEIFVRRDGLSRQYLSEHLAENGFAAVCSPVAEWVYYSDYLRDNGGTRYKMSNMEKLEFAIKKKTMAGYERRIKSVLSRSGLIHAEPVFLDSVIKNAAPFISPNLTGEAILTVGSALTEVASHVCGVIAIGPFGCMPNRLSEAILSEVMRGDQKRATEPKNKRLQMILSEVADLPFLSIESDGSPFPQLINAKLEAFCLRAKRLHAAMIDPVRRVTPVAADR